MARSKPGARTKREAAVAETKSAATAMSTAGGRLREQERLWREGLDEVETDLLERRGAPAWTIKFHSRMGHLGGAALFALGSVVFWPVLVVTAWQLLVVFGTRIVNEVPPMVLSELNVNSTVVTTRTDSFVFSWVMPVLFFVLVIAGVALWLLRLVVTASAKYSKRLALGLFAGYGTGLRTDWAAVSIARSQRRAEREAKRRSVAESKEALGED